MTQFGRDFESAYWIAVLGIGVIWWGGGGAEGASLFFYNVAITLMRVNIGNTRVEYTKLIMKYMYIVENVPELV